MEKSSLTTVNTTIIDNITAGYSLYILGNATISDSSRLYFNEINLLSDGISVEGTVFGALRDKVNITAPNGIIRVQGASPHINDSRFYSFLTLSDTTVSFAGIAIDHHEISISNSVVSLERFELDTRDLPYDGGIQNFYCSNSAVSINDSRFIGPGSKISFIDSSLEQTLTITHSSFDVESGSGRGGHIVLEFIGANIIFNQNNVSNGHVALQLGRNYQPFPISATIIGNNFINIEQPVRAYNTQLTVRDNRFIDIPNEYYSSEPISDIIPALITIYSDSIIPIRPAYDLKSTGYEDLNYEFKEHAPCDKKDTHTSVRWCASAYLELYLLIVRFDGTKIDMSNLVLTLSSGLWERTVPIKLTVGHETLLYFIRISDGSFDSLVIIVGAFYVTISIIIVAQRKFNRMLDKKGKTDYETTECTTKDKVAGTSKIPLPIMKEGNIPHKHRQKKKRAGHS